MRLAPLLFAALLIASPAWAHEAHSRNGQSTVNPASSAVHIGGPFTLTDTAGKPFTDKDLLGKFSFITFGFTFCPDICPTELQGIQSALDLAGEDAAQKTNVVFITIDPARDTAGRVGEFVRQFGNNITGLTGTPAQIAAVAKAYKIYYAKDTETDPGDDDYMMNHSSYIYLMGPDGKFITVFASDTSPQAMADELQKQMAARH